MLKSKTAWLELGEKSFAITTRCAIGRVPSNQLVLPNENVSRRHAIIHEQGDSGFWLVDLGSSNGTFVNGRRVARSLPLHEGDQIEIGPFHLVFHAAASEEFSDGDPADDGNTIRMVKRLECWLLVADIMDSTLLARHHSADDLQLITGQWFDRCNRIVERSGGLIDKHLGDGFLAYWHAEPGSGRPILEVLEQFKACQTSGFPPFRVVLHQGTVNLGGMATMGDAMVFGPEVNFTFRMERIASALGVARLLSEAARKKMGGQANLVEAGRHKLPGFEGEFLFFSLDP